MGKKFGYYILAVVFFIVLWGNAADAADDASAAAFSDVGNHRKAEHINRMAAEGVLGGYPDGTFKPDRNISRVELVAIINGIFNNQEKSSRKFKDVAPKDWFSGEIAKAVAAGYITGYEDGTVRPGKFVTRQEGYKIVADAFGLSGLASDSYAAFSDAGAVQQWARNSTGVLLDRGYIIDDGSGKLLPRRFMTRAEAVELLDRAAGLILNTNGTSFKDKTVEGNLFIRSSVSALENISVNGDLYIPQSVLKQNIVLDNVRIKGRLYIRNNKLDSIRMKGGETGGIIIAGQAARVHLELEGSTVSGTLGVFAASLINVGSGSRVEKVELEAGASGTVIEAVSGVQISNRSKNIIVNGVAIDEGAVFTTTDSLDLINIY